MDSERRPLPPFVKENEMRRAPSLTTVTTDGRTDSGAHSVDKWTIPLQHPQTWIEPSSRISRGGVDGHGLEAELISSFSFPAEPKCEAPGKGQSCKIAGKRPFSLFQSAQLGSFIPFGLLNQRGLCHTVKAVTACACPFAVATRAPKYKMTAISTENG